MRYMLGVDFVTLMRDGGFFMWPILLCAVVAAVITVERAFFLFVRASVNADVLMAQVYKSVVAGDLDRALRLCAADPRAALPRVVKAGIVNAHRDPAGLRDAIDEAVLEVTPEVLRRSSLLPMIANVSTLLGLLGTIAGLIMAFDAVAHAAPAEEKALLAIGIAVAMYTTAGGLIVAIPTLLAHGLLQQRAVRLLDEIDLHSAKLVNLLADRERAAARAVARP